MCAVGVMVNHRNTCEPDVALLHSPATREHHFFTPPEVVLVVEIVSAGTCRRDRVEKPEIYAAAGIEHFWLIEQDPTLAVYAFRLVGGKYRPAGDTDADGVLTLAAPFPISLPLAALGDGSRRRS